MMREQGPIMSKPPTLLIDTNVWLDYFDPARPAFKDAFELFDLCYAEDVELYYTAAGLTDVFFIIGMSQKHAIREERGQLTDSEASAINELAWGCIRHMHEAAMPLPQSPAILCEAFNLKAVYRDFEDDVVMATARLANIDFLVTNDRTLLTKATVPALSARDMVAYLRTL